MNSMLLVIALSSIATFLAAAVIYLIFKRQRESTIGVHASLERIREMGDLTVMTAYIKEVVTMRTEEDNLLSTTGKLLVICPYEIEFRYNLRKIKVSMTGDMTNIVLPPHFLKAIPQKVQFYDERKAAYLGFLAVDFTTDERNRLLEEAGVQAVKQAGVLQGDLYDKVQASARATLSTLAHAFGAKNVCFSFEESASVVQQITHQNERHAA